MEFWQGFVCGVIITAIISTFVWHRLHRHYERELEAHKKLIRRMKERLERRRR